MSNLKKVLALALVFAMSLTVMVGAIPLNYADAEDFKATGDPTLLDTAVNSLFDLNILVGNKEKVEDAEGNESEQLLFNPNATIDRAMLARIGYAILNKGQVIPATWEDKVVTTPFTDVSNSWAKGYIAYGYTMGYLSGTGEKTYEPTKEVTGFELASMLVRMAIGYTADDVVVYPNDVDILGRTFGNNIYSLGIVDGRLIEIDGSKIIDRQTAAVMIYNAILTGTTILPKDNQTIGYYVASGHTYIKSVYPDYEYAADGKIEAIGSSVVRNVGSLTPEEGYVILSYTGKDKDGKDTTKFVKTANAKATRKDLLEDKTLLGAIGGRVKFAFYNGAVKTLYVDPAYNVVTATAKDVTVTENANGYATISVKVGENTYTKTDKISNLAYGFIDVAFNGVGDYISGKNTAADSTLQFKAIKSYLEKVNADKVYFTVKDKEITDFNAIETYTAKEIATISGNNYTFANDTTKTFTNSTKYMLDKDKEMKFAVKDLVLVNDIYTDASAAGTTQYIDIVAATVPTTLTVTTMANDGTYYTGDKKIVSATGALNTLKNGSQADIISVIGSTNTFYMYDGLYYNVNTVSASDTGNYLVTTAAPASGMIGSAQFTYGVPVLFADNSASTIVVSKINGIDLSKVGYIQTGITADTVYSYNKLSDGTYALYSVEGSAGWKTGKTLTPINATPTVFDGNRIAANAVVFTKVYDATTPYWEAIPNSSITAIGTINTAVAGLVATVDGYATTKVMKVTETSGQLVTTNFAPAEKYMYVTGITSGIADFTIQTTLTGVMANGVGGAADTKVVLNDKVVLPALKVGDIVRLTYNNAAATSVRTITVESQATVVAIPTHNAGTATYANITKMKDGTYKTAGGVTELNGYINIDSAAAYFKIAEEGAVPPPPPVVAKNLVYATTTTATVVAGPADQVNAVGTITGATAGFIYYGTDKIAAHTNAGTTITPESAFTSNIVQLIDVTSTQELSAKAATLNAKVLRFGNTQLAANVSKAVQSCYKFTAADGNVFLIAVYAIA